MDLNTLEASLISLARFQVTLPQEAGAWPDLVRGLLAVHDARETLLEELRQRFNRTGWREITVPLPDRDLLVEVYNGRTIYLAGKGGATGWVDHRSGKEIEGATHWRYADLPS